MGIDRVVMSSFGNILWPLTVAMLGLSCFALEVLLVRSGMGSFAMW